MKSPEILLIEPGVECEERFVRVLTGAGYSVRVAGQSGFLDTLDHQGLEAIVLGAGLDYSDQERLAKELRERLPRVQLILCAEVRQLSAALRLAHERLLWVLQLPCENEDLLNVVVRACVLFHVTMGRSLRPEPSVSAGGGIVGFSEAMQRIFVRLEKIAALDATVLLQGESGTGKTILASFIHRTSKRKHKQFLALNCAALPKELLESELFGHEKGAFTGASTGKQGIFEQCDGGTVLLDELGELPFELQPKLLSFLQDKLVRRVGGRTARRVDVRIIAATNRNLPAAVNAGTFRSDLFYRVNVLTVDIPPLRERRADIAALADLILARITTNSARSEPWTLAPEALRELEGYHWPGNVRELEHVLERACAFAESSIIAVKYLELTIASHQTDSASLRLAGRTLQDVEAQLFSETLDLCEGDKVRAAELLGVSLKTVYNFLRRRGSRTAPPVNS